MATQVDVGSEVVSQEESHETQTAEPQEGPAETADIRDADRNWKQAREVMEEQKRQLKVMQDRERLYQEELARLQAKPPQKAEPEEVFNEDDILTVAQAKKLAQREVQRLLQQESDKKGEDVARQEFPDYDAVVTPDNLERLRREKPRLFESIAGNPTLYGKASTAYAALKVMMGGSASAETQQAQAKLKENLGKPRSALSVNADRALHQAHNFENGLTAEVQKSLLQEMQNARRNY